MFCRFCGAEFPNDSVFCPSCGKKQAGGEAGPNAAAAVLPVPDAGTVKRNRKPLILGLVIAGAVILLALAGFFIWRQTTINAFHIPLNAMYNPEQGIGVQLGWTKSKIDGLFGSPQFDDNSHSYIYDNGLIAIYLDDNTASYIGVKAGTVSWVFYDGLFSGASKDKLIESLGKPHATVAQYYCYYFDKNHVPTQQKENLDFYLTISVIDEEIYSVGIISNAMNSPQE